MSETVELRRHTDNDGDVLTDEGIRAAVEIGRTLTGPYDLVVSSGAQRATQAAACFLAGLGQPTGGGVVVDAGFRSEHEDRWRAIYQDTKDGSIGAFLAADADFVGAEAERFVAALRRVVGRLPSGGRALVIGHSPMHEAAVFGATGEQAGPLGKGEGVTLVHEDGAFRLGEDR